MTSLFRRLRARLRYRHFNAELKDELDVHRAMAEDERRASGEPPDEARRRTARQLGNVTLARESARSVWIAPWLEGLWRDVRYAARGLWRSPTFTFAAVSALVIAVSVNASVFAAMNGLLLRPWLVPEGDRLVNVYQVRLDEKKEIELLGLSVAEYRHLAARSATVDLVALRDASAAIETPAGARDVAVRLVSSSFFDVLMSPPVVGRGFRPDEDDATPPSAVAVIAHDLWQQDFAGAPDIVGRTFRIHNQAFTIVGVARPFLTDTAAAARPQIWAPLASMPFVQPRHADPTGFLTDPVQCCVRVAGRLRTDVTMEIAEAEMVALDRAFARPDESTVVGMRVTGTALIHQPIMARQFVPRFTRFFAGAALLLVLACANVGNLQLARAMTRRREMTARISLGASRGRLIQQLLVEGLLLSIVAGAVAWAVAIVLPSAILRWIGGDGDYSMFDLTPDARVMWFLGGIVVVATTLSGLAPALHSTSRLVAGRFDLTERRTRLRSTLLAVQVAVTVVLLLAGALAYKGVARVSDFDFGFAVHGTTLVSLEYPLDYRPTAPGGDVRRSQFQAALAADAERAGLVIGATTRAPFGNTRSLAQVRRPDQVAGEGPTVHRHQVSPGYFDVLRIPLIAGQRFVPNGEVADSVLVNETLARALWDDGGGLGRQLVLDRPRVVIGVVADARTDDVERAVPTVYEPAADYRSVLVWSDPTALARLEALVSSLEPRVRIRHETLDANIQARLRGAIVGARLTAVMGAFALFLAAVGTFGVASYIVGERTREIGVRLALGANGASIARAMAARFAWPLAGGAAAGLLLAQWTGGVLEGSLYGLDPHDPVVYAAVLAVLSGASALALLVPLRRALRVDPVITLRHE